MNSNENGLKMAEILQEMIDAAKALVDGEIDFTTMEENLSSGIEDINKVAEFKEKFNALANNMSTFETDISTEFAAKMGEIGEAMLELLILSKVDKTESERLKLLTEHMREKLMNIPDTSEWTEKEYAEVASMYVMAIENGDVKILNMIGDIICMDKTVGYREQRTCYYGGIQPEMSLMLLKHIDPYTQGEAYFTLKRMSFINNNYEFGGLGFGSDINFTLNEAGEVVVEINFEGTSIDRDKDLGKFKFVSSDLYAESDVENMKSLGFTDEEIVGILSGVWTEQDKEKVLELTACNSQEDYEKLFGYNPDYLSDFAKESYFMYAFDLYENAFEIDQNQKITVNQEHKFTQLEKFVNGILSKPDIYVQIYNEFPNNYKSYTSEYLEELAFQTQQLLEANSVIIELDYQNVSQDTINTQHKLLDMYSLYGALGGLEKNVDEYKLIGKWNEQLTKKMTEQIFLNKRYNQIRISDLKLTGENQISYANSDLKFDISVKYMDDDLSENRVILSRVLPDNLDDIEELYDYYERKEESEKAVGNAIRNTLVGAASARFPAAAIIAYAAMAAEDPSYTSASAAFKQVGVVTGPKYDQGNAPWDAGCILEGMGTVAAAYQARDEAYEEILDDWYVGGTQVSVNADGNNSFITAKGMYDPEVLIKRQIVLNDGFAGLYTDDVNGEYDHVQKGLEVLNNCHDEEKDAYEYVDNIRNVGDVTHEEKIEMLEILWRGPQNDEEMQKLTNLTADQYQQYVKGLSVVLKSEENSENIFEDINVEKKFKG